MVLKYNEDFRMLVNEGLVYAVNSSLCVSVGGAPAPITQFYLFLSTANRNWAASDTAANIHDDSQEFETYDEASRPSWSPQALAEAGDISLDNTGDEALYTIGDVSGLPGGKVVIYGAGIISVSAKNGTSDATATLIAGGNFPNPRELFSNDKLSVGAAIVAADGS